MWFLYFLKAFKSFTEIIATYFTRQFLCNFCRTVSKITFNCPAQAHDENHLSVMHLSSCATVGGGGGRGGKDGDAGIRRTVYLRNPFISLCQAHKNMHFCTPEKSLAQPNKFK